MLRISFAVMLMAAVVGSAHAQAYRTRLTLDDLVEKSDVILVAECTYRDSAVKKQNLVTEYKLKPSEFLKGFVDLNKDGEIVIEELGGMMTTIPLMQKPDGFADISTGEEVVLFMKRNESKAKGNLKDDPRFIASTDVNGLRIVGRKQGRFTVIKHPNTGEKIVAHPNGLAYQLRRVNENKSMLVPEGDATNMKVVEKTGAEATKIRSRLIDRLEAAVEKTQTKHAEALEKNADAKEYLDGFLPLSSLREKVHAKLKSESKD